MIFIALVGLTLGFNDGIDKNISWLDGTWTGVGYQSPTNTTWDIKLNYEDKGKNISIGYPTLNCSGQWELQDYEKNRAVFIERITKGVNNCDNNVTVIVTKVSEYYISVAYFLPDLYDGVVAYSILKKEVNSKL